MKALSKKSLAVLDKARRDWRRTQNCSFHRVPIVFLDLVVFYSEEIPNSRGVLYLKLPAIDNMTWVAFLKPEQ